jgi:hypothetical protein
VDDRRRELVVGEASQNGALSQSMATSSKSETRRMVICTSRLPTPRSGWSRRCGGPCATLWPDSTGGKTRRQAELLQAMGVGSVRPLSVAEREALVAKLTRLIAEAKARSAHPEASP